MDNNIKNKAASLEILKEVKDKLEGDIGKTKESFGILNFLFPDTNVDNITDVDAMGNVSDISDASELFIKDNLIVRQNGYKLDTQTMLSLKDKKITGGGSVVWKDYKDNSYFDPQYLMTGETKLEYIHDPVYMSMKEPSEAISSHMPTRTNGALLYYQPEGYTNLIGIGALYAGDPDNLPEEFTLCLGALKTYTLSDEPNAKWICHEEHKYPLGLTVYELPWTTHVSYPLEDGQIEYCDNYVRLHLKKKNLTNAVIHFWGSSKRIIDLKHTIGIVVMYEAWTETENLTGDIFATTGADQRIVFNSGNNDVKQAMSGKNWLVKPEHRLVISHNIPDKIYDELKYTANDPEKLINAFYEIEKYVEPIEEKPFYYTLPKKCIIGYSEETDDYLKIGSIAYNSDSNIKFVNIGFDIEKTGSTEMSKSKKDINVLISTKNDTATCKVYANNYNDIVVCNDSENKVVNIYIKVSQYAYTNLVLRNVIGYTSLVTFEETFINLFDRTKFANFMEENTTKELQGTPISVIDTELKLPVNDGNIIKNLGHVEALNVLKNNPKEGVYYYYLNGWDSIYEQEPYNILPPSNVSSFYFVESRFRYFDNDKTMLYGEQTWHNLVSGIAYTKTMVNNVWKPFNEPGSSLTPSQVVQMYNEIKQESEG